MEATLDHRTVDADECRRLAQTLRLDAVGVLRRGATGRTLTWWSAPGAPARPLDVESIIDGRADGWISVAHGDDLAFARLTDRSSAGSTDALRAMLERTTSSASAAADGAPQDRLVEDRARWAYAIHDGLTQAVTAAILDLEWLARRAEAEPAEAPRALSSAAGELRAALAEIRAILAAVTPDGDAFDRRRALDELLRRVADRWHVPASWAIEGDLDRVPAPVMEAATSIIREGVANAAKHSSSRSVAVRVHARPSEMEVSVEDAGRGFRPDDAHPHAGHLGLEMMRRRAAEVHGTLDIESEPGRGTRVTARLPVEEGETT